MNLHKIVRGAITAVNLDIPATLRRSIGYTVEEDGTQVPQYEEFTGKIQVQGINPKDLVHVNNMNIQGNLRTVWLFGNWFGIVRAGEKGGDILLFPAVKGGEDCEWLVVIQKEVFPDWCSVIVCQQ